MRSPMLTKISSSGLAGGGDAGMVAGIVPDIMTMAGSIITAIRTGMEGSLMTGGIIIETMSGKGTPGIIVPFLTGIWTGIGEMNGGDMTTAGIILADPIVGIGVPVMTEVLVTVIGVPVIVIAVLVKMLALADRRRGKKDKGVPFPGSPPLVRK